jgi:hypothetical protein
MGPSQLMPNCVTRESRAKAKTKIQNQTKANSNQIQIKQNQIKPKHKSLVRANSQIQILKPLPPLGMKRDELYSSLDVNATHGATFFRLFYARLRCIGAQNFGDPCRLVQAENVRTDLAANAAPYALVLIQRNLHVRTSLPDRLSSLK